MIGTGFKAMGNIIRNAHNDARSFRNGKRLEAAPDRGISGFGQKTANAPPSGAIHCTLARF
jgi:hypothetical protein